MNVFKTNILETSMLKNEEIPRIIGICGYSRVGKDTAGDILEKGFGYKKKAFADNLREIAKRINPLISDGFEQRRYNSWIDEYGYDSAKEKVSGLRPFLVTLGESIRNVLGKNIWIDAVLSPENLTENIVIMDVRYGNEANRIKELGGIIIRIDRPHIGPANETEAKSIPEILPNIIINNNGSIEELRNNILSAIYSTKTVNV